MVYQYVTGSAFGRGTPTMVGAITGGWVGNTTLVVGGGHVLHDIARVFRPSSRRKKGRGSEPMPSMSASLGWRFWKGTYLSPSYSTDARRPPSMPPWKSGKRESRNSFAGFIKGALPRSAGFADGGYLASIGKKMAARGFRAPVYADLPVMCIFGTLWGFAEGPKGGYGYKR